MRLGGDEVSRHLVGRDVLHPAGPELVHDHGALLGAHGDPPRGRAVGHLGHMLHMLHLTHQENKVSQNTKH